VRGGELGDDERDELGEDLRGERRLRLRLKRLSFRTFCADWIDGSLSRHQSLSSLSISLWPSHLLQLLFLRQRQARQDAVEGLELGREGRRWRGRHDEGGREERE